MKKRRVRRKLLSFTDTKTEALRKRIYFKRKGFKRILIKSQYGGYSVLGLKKKAK